ncbi:hypothetical protein OGAPHI_003913 [Ogataea philodendri]|uniref:Signal peptidase complex subunit 2 n=1 Tax=Ogataea philodendri TaxID=1378263 RepID=A0A9P8P640_9ASCO|nr:uncharacterized protein OGAPHI_003913 [Ogataea philodendri]KAH3665725.1 hypothetical protein OGAPHI_003913 [Ogataea philodendri]
MKKVNLYSAIALRNECDEHLPGVFLQLGYEQSFFNTDFKLVVGYLSVITSGLLYWLEKKYNNDFTNTEYFNYTAALVAVFFFFNTIWVVFTKYIEKDVKYVGTKGSKKLTVSTKIKSKTEPVYLITIDNGGSRLDESLDLTKVFNSDGYLVLTEFKSCFQKLVEKTEKST